MSYIKISFIIIFILTAQFTFGYEDSIVEREIEVISADGFPRTHYARVDYVNKKTQIYKTHRGGEDELIASYDWASHVFMYQQGSELWMIRFHFYGFKMNSSDDYISIYKNNVLIRAFKAYEVHPADAFVIADKIIDTPVNRYLGFKSLHYMTSGENEKNNLVFVFVWGGGDGSEVIINLSDLENNPTAQP